MTTRAFHVGDLLSVTTGCLVSPDHVEGIYNILNYLTGDSLFTHQLPRAAEAMAPVLLEQHPWLANAGALKPDDFGPDTRAGVDAYLAVVIERYGAEHPVAAAPDRWRRQDPIEELVARVGADRVIPVVIPDN